MIDLTPRTITIAALVVPTIITGYLLSSNGPPYNQLLFTVHKLMPVAALVLLDVTAVQTHRFMGLEPTQSALAIGTNVFFLATIVSGGVVSLETQMPAVVQWIHRIGPWASTAASAALLWALWRQ